MAYNKLINKMTLEEKASLCSGLDMWHTKPIERLGVPSIMMTDGPHGLRKQSEEHSGIHSSVPSTSFPTASCSACSWDTELLRQMGDAIGKEALQEEIGVVLGPGTNIKRSPLCGRNFEYFSEDPYLAGKLSAGFITGVENNGISTSLKHFAVNNQETLRMTISAMVDERALREIYLKPFEIAVKESRPSTLMCSYNKINGVYASENKKILTDILRDEWGFNGLVMSDWGATNLRTEGVVAGLDLEMPGSGGVNDAKIVEAVKNKKLSEDVLNTAVERVLNVVDRAVIAKDNKSNYDAVKHQEIARKVARESAVLLKNYNNSLPLSKNDKILIIGEMAEKPRYQGAGSSHITPSKLTSFLDALKDRNINFDYIRGYDSNKSGKIKKNLINEAVEKAKNYAKVLVFVGLTDEYESEGFDRKNIDLPLAHNELIYALISEKVNLNVVLSCGAPVAMPWLDRVNSVLMMYLAGSDCGNATADLIFGDCNPCGKLAETFPYSIEETPSFNSFPGNRVNVVHNESVFVGYRYYNTARVETLFPFGYGLSYTQFSYDNISCSQNTMVDSDTIDVEFELTNIGNLKGKEIVQLYIKDLNNLTYKAEKELKAFTKVELDPKQTTKVKFSISKSAFEYYNAEEKEWIVNSGDYEILVCSSSEDIKLSTKIKMISSNNVLPKDFREIAPTYFDLKTKKFNNEDFVAIYGSPIFSEYLPPKKGSFTAEHSFLDIMPYSKLAKIIIACAGMFIRKAIKAKKNDPSYLMMIEIFKTSPLRTLEYSSQGVFSNDMLKGLLIMLNGKMFKGLRILLKAMKGKKINIKL